MESFDAERKKNPVRTGFENSVEKPISRGQSLEKGGCWLAVGSESQTDLNVTGPKKLALARELQRTSSEELLKSE